MAGLSGKALGAEYLRRIEAYLAAQEVLPVSEDGTLNITTIAEQSGIPKQSIYKNPAIRKAIEDAKNASGVQSWAQLQAYKVTAATALPPSRQENEPRDNKRLQAAERRLSALEQQNAALTAENFELRKQVKMLKQQLSRQDMVIDTGRRVPPPVAQHD